MSERNINVPADSLTAGELVAIAEKKAEEVIEKLKTFSFTLALAESCTAGLVSGLLANTSGASSVLWGSYVCYTQDAKVNMLSLDNDALNANGLVSRETACSMAEGALKKSGADLSAAVTGLAGPDSDGRVPGGTIWIAAAGQDAGTPDKAKLQTAEAKEFHFSGARNEVRLRAAAAVLEMILEQIEKRGA